MAFSNAFPPVTKEDWLQQIKKDLKGQELSSLTWHIAPHLSVDPLVAAGDAAVLSAPLSASAHWETGEMIHVTDPGSARVQALEALQMGAEGLHFYLPSVPDQVLMDTLLEGIHTDYIGLHFSGPGMETSPGGILTLLEAVAARGGVKPQQLRGSLQWSPLEATLAPDWRYARELIELVHSRYPGFSVISLGSDGISDPVESLSELMYQANECITRLHEVGLSPAQAASAIQFRVATGVQYFVEIARLRALKVLWVNVLSGWGVTPEYPRILATCAPEAYTDALYTNMIRATTIAMSAVIGGATHLVVRPYDEGREAQSEQSPTFARRIARNVQHLLKMESGLDQIPDPAAGSYYIEQLTRQMAEKSWAIFQERV